MNGNRQNHEDEGFAAANNQDVENGQGIPEQSA